MRRLMWFSLGFAVSCGILAYGMNCPWLLPAAAAAGILAIAAVGCSRKPQWIHPALAVLAGGLAGFLWFGIFGFLYLDPAAALDGQTTTLCVTASDYGCETNYGTVVDAVTSIEGKPYQIRVYHNEKIEIAPGDTVDGVFRVRLAIADRNNPSTYYQGKGVFLLAYPENKVTIYPADDIPKWCYPAVLRQRILNLLEDVMPEDAEAFAKALLIGKGEDLDYAANTSFRVSGIRHIIAVSGLHISILYGLICTVTLRRRYLTALMGMPTLLLFAAVAGFTPSVVRSCIMVWLMLFAMVFDREYDPPTALGFSVLVMLVVNPLAVTSVSMQLSVGCVAGILLFNAPINQRLKGMLRTKKGVVSKLWSMFCSSVSVTLSAMSLVTPLSACYFGPVSLVGVLTNIFTLWAVNLIFNGLVAVCLLHLLWPAVTGVLAWVLAWLIRYVLMTAKVMASIPMAAVYTKSSYIVFWLVFAYLLLAGFLVMKKKRPVALLCCGTIGLCLALLASWTEPLTSGVRVTMLDVGQGQAVLLQSEGRTFLVDCGGDSDEKTADIVAETLLSQGVRRLDGIILTHYDWDHAGALHNLLTRVDTDYLFLPDTHNAFQVPHTTGQTLFIWQDMKLSFGACSLQIYGPVYSGLSNENSLCVLFDTEKCDILITGDRSAFGERMLLRSRTLPDVDILVAGHHGAAGSTSEELLQMVQPETVLISAAKDNIYGHPADALLQRLERYGCTVYRTDEHGTITIRR